MECNLNRIKRDIEVLSRFTSTPGEGCTRFTYSTEHRMAMDYLINEMKKLGLNITVDPIGNIRARLNGLNNNAPVVMTGSHIDSVNNGGNFDGVVGVVGGLEAIRVMVENNIKVSNPIELIIFVEEEGPNFSSLVGSKVLCGQYTLEDLYKFENAHGVSMYEAAKKFGLNPNDIYDYTFKPNEIKTMIEMHIEQSVVLEHERVPVGIVEAVAGRKWINIELVGVSNHAGTTPMKYRYDPMVVASKIISSIEDILKENCNPTTVATVGRITCIPNAPNVVPGKVSFTIDVRDVCIEGIESFLNKIEEVTKNISDSRGLDYKIAIMSETKPIKLSESVVEVIEARANKRNIKYKKMNSGALHDACILRNITDVGMIFVPSIKGRSHTREEYTKYEDIKIGCDLLISSLIELAK